ncbi:hypothetical protein ACHFJ0_04870 [Paracoccus sp. NGMCC 1.201697]|uniref:Uncharacterized protein n=1 Tax=Paracoccus broussonetiae subsp. drimophilus TaxID=3373869 RepID=A0ABW7LIM3_9RHOB
MAPSTEDAEQIAIAARIVLGLLRLQTQTQGTVPMEDLPGFLLMAADERDRQGDFGAGRMLNDWADMLRDWE